MKLILTESKYKNILFRYWDKTGGKVDKTFISFNSIYLILPKDFTEVSANFDVNITIVDSKSLTTIF